MTRKVNDIILITGSSGFIGGQLVSYLTDKNFLVMGLDIKAKGKQRIDVCNSKKMVDFLNFYQPRVIIHTAAIKSLEGCESNKVESWETNVGSTQTLVQYVHSHPKVKLIYFSSDVIFDGKNGDYKETDLPNPINWYGKTKLYSELLVRQLENFAVCRTALVLGDLPENNLLSLKKEIQKPILDNQSLLPHYVFNRLLRYQEVRLPTDVISSPTHVNLICKVIEKILKFDSRGVFHCAGSEPISRFELACRIADFCHLNKKLVIKDNSRISELRPKDISMNIESTYRRLGLKPESGNVEAILKEINFLKLS